MFRPFLKRSLIFCVPCPEFLFYIFIFIDLHGGAGLKILRVISSLRPEGGGPIEGVKLSQRFLEEQGVRVEIVCADTPGSPWLSDPRLPKVYPLGPARGGYAYTDNLVPWLKLNARNYDAVVVHGLWQFHGFAVRSALTKLGVPYFVFPHGMLDPWFKQAYPLKHLKKWLYWPWAEYRVLRDAKAVIFTSEEERQQAKKSFWLYRANEVVSAYGTDAPPLDDGLSESFLAQYPELKNKRLFLYLSRIHEKKGCDLLIEAFSRVAKLNANLHLVMAGPDQTGWAFSLKNRAAELGIADRITWPGMLTGESKWGAFYSSEIFCLPSHQENFGIVVAEALACGRPVLISDKVNIWREITDNGSGFVASDTLDGTLANIEKWLALSPIEQRNMQSQARLCFERNFHVRSAAERLVEIIEENKDDH